MDVPRQNADRKRLLRRIATGTVVLCAVSAVASFVFRLKPAAPSVEKGTVWMDTVKQGQMLREVRGIGTLVPEEIRYVPAPYNGRVATVHMLPGVKVMEDTLLVELRNTDMEQQEIEAKSNLATAELELANLRAQLELQRLDRRAALATAEAQYKNAKAKSDRDEMLFKQGLLLELDYNLSKTSCDELTTRYTIEHERDNMLQESLAAQLAAKQTSVQQQRDLVKLRREQLSALKVRAGVAGVLQQVLVQAGQTVAAGTNLAIVVQPKKLKAELKVAETQAKDVQIGQLASIDTHNGIIAGRVSRIDPSVREGSVVVDVGLESELPQGVRPDLSVDGTIQIEKLDNVIYVRKPANMALDSVTQVFCVSVNGQEATRRRVRLGRSSVNTIEVVAGLQVGDRVILSDMSQYEAYDRVRLN
jgi:HlyD family secretion protein